MANNAMSSSMPEWAIYNVPESVSGDFVWIIDALDPAKNRLTAAWKISRYLKDDGKGIYEAWARQNKPEKGLVVNDADIERDWQASFLMDDSEAEDWETPAPLVETLKPVPAFDEGMLPLALHGWVKDISTRMTAPTEFAAVAAMVALSSVIGTKAAIQPKRNDDWCLYPNLWGVLVGRPGVKKSPVINAALKPLNLIEEENAKRYQKELDAYRIESKARELANKSALKKAEKIADEMSQPLEEVKKTLAENSVDTAQEPVLRRFITTDATVEALEELLLANPNGVLIHRDELSALISDLDKPDKGAARGFYLQGYDGTRYTVDRILRGMNQQISSVCLSMIGGIQPAKLAGYIKAVMHGGPGDDGLLQRFSLMVWPDPLKYPGYVDKEPDHAAFGRALAVFKRIDAMPLGKNGKPSLVYRFATDAQEAYVHWQSGLEHEISLHELHPALESHISKYQKLVPALALICAMADDEPEVSLQSLRRATAWAKHLRCHAERAYFSESSAVNDSAAALLRRIERGEVTNGFTVRDIYTKGWSQLRDAKTVEEAVDLLCDHRHVMRMPANVTERGGRPKNRYRVHPWYRG